VKIVEVAGIARIFSPSQPSPPSPGDSIMRPPKIPAIHHYWYSIEQVSMSSLEANVACSDTGA